MIKKARTGGCERVCGNLSLDQTSVRGRPNDRRNGPERSELAFLENERPKFVQKPRDGHFYPDQNRRQIDCEQKERKADRAAALAIDRSHLAIDVA